MAGNAAGAGGCPRRTFRQRSRSTHPAFLPLPHRPGNCHHPRHRDRCSTKTHRPCHGPAPQQARLPRVSNEQLNFRRPARRLCRRGSGRTAVHFLTRLQGHHRSGHQHFHSLTHHSWHFYEIFVTHSTRAHLDRRDGLDHLSTPDAFHSAQCQCQDGADLSQCGKSTSHRFCRHGSGARKAHKIRASCQFHRR